MGIGTRAGSVCKSNARSGAMGWRHRNCDHVPPEAGMLDACKVAECQHMRAPWGQRMHAPWMHAHCPRFACALPPLCMRSSALSCTFLACRLKFASMKQTGIASDASLALDQVAARAVVRRSSHCSTAGASITTRLRLWGLEVKRVERRGAALSARAHSCYRPTWCIPFPSPVRSCGPTRLTFA